MKPKIGKGTRAQLRVDVSYLDMGDRHTAYAGSFVVIDSTNSMGGASVRQTVLGRQRETHCFFVRLDKLEAVA